MTSSVATAGGTGARPWAAVRGRDRRFWLVVSGLVLAVLGAMLGVAFGSVSVPLGDTVTIVIDKLLGTHLSTADAATQAIVWDLRVPRVLLAMTVGCGLAVAGATFQGLLRNPLADPYVLGTASGAALGAAIGLLIPVHLFVFGFGLANIFAFAGAVVSITVVYRLARVTGLAPLTGLLLTGYAVASLLAAGLTMAMYLSGAALRQIFTYLLGSFEQASWERLAGALPIVLLGSIVIATRARSLNGLLLGEQAAAHLGINVERERPLLLGLGALVTAAAVTVSGLIGFVGLVVPHIVRLLTGPNARAVIPISGIWGAVLLVYSDLAARVAGDIPVGVVTAIIGAPFFLALLRRARTGYEL
ncbi:MAG: iron ABC transporter permease [Chloroflexota bacterium]